MSFYSKRTWLKVTVVPYRLWSSDNFVGSTNDSISILTSSSYLILQASLWFIMVYQPIFPYFPIFSHKNEDISGAQFQITFQLSMISCSFWALASSAPRQGAKIDGFCYGKSCQNGWFRGTPKLNWNYSNAIYGMACPALTPCHFQFSSSKDLSWSARFQSQLENPRFDEKSHGYLYIQYKCSFKVLNHDQPGHMR